MFSPLLGMFIACLPLIAIQLLLCFAETLSDEKHCRQNIQKCFLFLCLDCMLEHERVEVLYKDLVLFFVLCY